MSERNWVQDAVFKGKEMRALYPKEQAGDDGEYVKDSYEEHWGKKIQGLRAKMEKGETIAHMMAALRTPPHMITAYNRVGGQIAKAVLEGYNGKHEGVPLSRLGMTEGRYHPQFNFDPLVHIKRSSAKFRNIVELGAGPGWNLFDIATYLGSKVQSKRLFGLEYSDAGVEIIGMLAEYENLPMEAHQFDYTQPDISMVPDDGPTLFYSHLSIEQVEDISRDLYAQMAKRRTPTTLIHVEPIGWQRISQLARARMEGDDDLFRGLIADRLDDLDSEFAGVRNAAINSWRVKYNRNALSHIKYFEKHSRLRIDHAYWDFTHQNNVNAANPCSFIQCTFTRGEQDAEADDA